MGKTFIINCKNNASCKPNGAGIHAPQRVTKGSPSAVLCTGSRGRVLQNAGFQARAPERLTAQGPGSGWGWVGAEGTRVKQARHVIRMQESQNYTLENTTLIDGLHRTEDSQTRKKVCVCEQTVLSRLCDGRSGSSWGGSGTTQGLSQGRQVTGSFQEDTAMKHVFFSRIPENSKCQINGDLKKCEL